MRVIHKPRTRDRGQYLSLQSSCSHLSSQHNTCDHSFSVSVLQHTCLSQSQLGPAMGLDTRHIFSANISQYFIQNLNLLGLSNYYCVENWFVIIDLDLKWYGSQRIKMSFGAGRNSYFLVW